MNTQLKSSKDEIKTNYRKISDYLTGIPFYKRQLIKSKIFKFNKTLKDRNKLMLLITKHIAKIEKARKIELQKCKKEGRWSRPVDGSLDIDNPDADFVALLFARYLDRFQIIQKNLANHIINIDEIAFDIVVALAD